MITVHSTEIGMPTEGPFAIPPSAETWSSFDALREHLVDAASVEYATEVTTWYFDAKRDQDERRTPNTLSIKNGRFMETWTLS